MPPRNSPRSKTACGFAMLVVGCTLFAGAWDGFAQAVPPQSLPPQPVASVSDVAPPAVATSGPSAVASTKPAVPETPAPPAGELAPVPTPGIPKSLFLSTQDHVRISNAMADYQNFLLLKKNHQEEQLAQKPENPGDALHPEKPQQRFYTYPQFFLESLVYHSPDDWVVRINGHKFLPPIINDDGVLSVISIDNDKVIFRWKPEEMSRVLEVWDKLPENAEKQKPDNDNGTLRMDFNSPAAEKIPILPVTVDKVHRLVTFSLHSNQTFSSFAMRVLEGKVMPVTVENRVTDIPQAKPPAGDLLQGDGTPVDDSNSGLNGLMKTIEKH